MILKKSALSLEYERTQSSRSAKSREVICPETSRRVRAPEHPKAQGIVYSLTWIWLRRRFEHVEPSSSTRYAIWLRWAQNRANPCCLADWKDHLQSLDGFAPIETIHGNASFHTFDWANAAVLAQSTDQSHLNTLSCPVALVGARTPPRLGLVPLSGSAPPWLGSRNQPLRCVISHISIRDMAHLEGVVSPNIMIFWCIFFGTLSALLRARLTWWWVVSPASNRLR